MAQNLLLLFISEILSIVSVFSSLKVFAGGLSWLSIAALPAFVLMIFAYVGLRNENGKFKLAFYFTIVALALVVTNIILVCCQVPNVAYYISLVISVMGICITCYTIEGCLEVCSGDQQKVKFGKGVELAYGIGIIGGAILEALVQFGVFQNASLARAMIVVAMGVTVVAYIFYVAYLFVTYKYSK